MTLGNRIQKLRKEKGFSQEDLAFALGVSRQAISKWENDISSPDTENLIALAGILGVDLSALVPLEQEQPKEEGVPEKRSFPWMKLIAVLLLCLAVLFFALWHIEKGKEEKLELLCQASAASCLDALVEYRDSGAELDFLSAVSEFRAFMQAYHLLTEETSRHGNYTFLNEAYGYMLCDRGKIDDNLDLLIDAMAILSEDIFSYTGHDMMYDLYIRLRHG